MANLRNEIGVLSKLSAGTSVKAAGEPDAKNLKETIKLNKEVISLLEKCQNLIKKIPGEWADLPGYNAHVVSAVDEAIKVAKEYQKNEFEYSLKTGEY